MSADAGRAIEIFFSYAREDEVLAVELEKQLSLFKRQGIISSWHDRDIQAGQEWGGEIDRHLATADIILLLVSPDFLASDYVYSVEMQRAMDRHEAGEARVVPVILRPVLWSKAPFGGLKALPENGLPVTSWSDRDQALFDVAQGIQKIVQERLLLAPTKSGLSVQQSDAGVPGVFERVGWEASLYTEQFYGRGEELSTLERWILRDGCRLVAVLGMGGIGKTTLAAKVVEQVKGEFEYVYWESLQNAPLIQQLLRNCLQTFSDMQRTDLPTTLDDQITLLLQCLREHRCLLILDNVESVLKGGSNSGLYQEGYEYYGKLLQHVGKTFHRSCLVLTSREKPGEVARLQGQAVRSLELSGIGDVDGRELLHDAGLSGADEDWRLLIHCYSGNPLALKLVAVFIRELFGGDIAGFLQEDEIIFGDIRQVLDQQFQRLSVLEQMVMYWLAIEREAIPLRDLQAEMSVPVQKRVLLEVMTSLRQRFLIEAGNAVFALQPVIMEYVTGEIIDRVLQEFQQEAYELLANYAFMKAEAKDFVRQSQRLLILAPLAQRLLATLGKEEMQSKMERILTKQRQSGRASIDYTAGNVLNLLVYLGIDLHNYDFSRLQVRQAYLREQSLSDCNFAYADLTTSVFADAFPGILSVVFSPQEELVAAGTTNGEIWLWQYTTGKARFVYAGHHDGVWAVAFSPDGKLLASGSQDRTVRLWDVGTGHCKRVIGELASRIFSLAFSPDGAQLASGGDDHLIRIWELSTGHCICTLQGHTREVSSVTFSPDGTELISGSEDQTVRLWDVNTGHCLNILRGHTQRVRSVAISSDGAIVVSGSEDRTVRLWDAQTGRSLHVLQDCRGEVRTVAISPDDRVLASGSDDQVVRLWELSTGRCLHVLQGHKNHVWSVAFSPDGETLVSGSDDQAVRLWEVSTGRSLHALQGYVNRIWSVDFASRGGVLASGSDDWAVRLWEVSTGQCLRTLKGHTNRVRSVAFNHDGTRLASGSEDHTVCVWDVSTGRCLKRLQGHTAWIRRVAFSPDGTLLASGGEDQTVRLWDVNTGQCLQTLQGHAKEVRSVAFSPDGTMLASSGADQVIRIWEVSTGHCLRELFGHMSRVRMVTFSPDGLRLASSGEDRTVRLWEVSTGQCLHILQDHMEGVRTVAFSPNGNLLATDSQEGAVRVWDVGSWHCRYTLRQHDNRVRTIAFSPDGAMLVSGSDDGTIKLWEIETTTCLKTFRSDRPYERMDITGVKGLTDAQKATLRALGAVEK